MHEVESLSDRVAVLRHGCFEGDIATKDTNAEDMTNRMVGHKVTLNIERPEPVNPKPRLEVKGLTVKTEDGIVKLKDVSFTARSAEILGIAGISGCGQKELLEAIAGLQSTTAGSITYIEENGTRRTRRPGPPGDHGYGRVPFLRSGGPSGHGPCGRYGPYRQYDAPFLPEGPLRIYRP